MTDNVDREGDGVTVEELAAMCERMMLDGNGDRVVTFTNVEGPELWAVLPYDPANEAEPGMLFMATIEEAIG